MKRTILFLYLFLTSFIFSQQGVKQLPNISHNEILLRDGLYYQLSDYVTGSFNKPYSGRVYRIDMGSNGIKYVHEEFKIIEGKFHGRFLVWYENGQLLSINNYKDGLSDGTYIKYHSNGQMMEQGKYKDGIKVGSWKYYYSTGKLWKEEID